jgi:hypothetical protein
MENPRRPRLSLNNHLVSYIAISFLGFIAGFIISEIAIVILTGIGILRPPWHILIFTITVVVGAYIPGLLFAKKVPAACPLCGGTAFLKWPSKPIIYICSECGHIHKTRIRLGR